MKDNCGFQKGIVGKIKSFIQAIKLEFRYVAHHKVVDGLSTIKFHLLDHVVEDIYVAGLSSNILGGPRETTQKANKTAAKTQMKAKSIDLQQVNNICDLHAIERAFTCMDFVTTKKNKSKHKVVCHIESLPAYEMQ